MPEVLLSLPETPSRLAKMWSARRRVPAPVGWHGKKQRDRMAFLSFAPRVLCPALPSEKVVHKPASHPHSSSTCLSNADVELLSYVI
jgi:hypothetical protein